MTTIKEIEVKRLKGMKMPMKSKMEDDMEESMGIDASEMDEAEALDAEMDADAEDQSEEIALDSISDDEILAEAKRRGLMADDSVEDDMVEEDVEY